MMLIDKYKRNRFWKYSPTVIIAVCLAIFIQCSALAATYDFSNLGEVSDGFKPQGNRFLVSSLFQQNVPNNPTVIYYGSSESTVTGIIIKVDGTHLLSFDLNDMEFITDPDPQNIISLKITATRSVGDPVSVTVVPGNTSSFTLSGLNADLSAFTNVTQLQFDITMAVDKKVMFLDFATITISNALEAAADLALLNSVSSTTAVPQNELTYTIELTNNGPSDALNVNVIDTLPANTTFKSVSMGGGSGWQITTPSVGGVGTVSCAKSSVASGETSIFLLSVQVGTGAANNSTISNTATVSTSTNDPNSANNTSTASSTVSYPVRAKLPEITYFPTLTAACANASSPNTIDARGIEFAESLRFNQGKTLTIKGGYDSGFLSNSGRTTVGHPLIVNNGKLILDRVAVK